MKKIFAVFLLFTVLTSCISLKSTIMNIDDSIPGPGLNDKYGSFIITKNAKDSKYAYNQDYPVNVGFTSLEDGEKNQLRFLNALAGPNGEKIKFEMNI